ncbi:helix-turn-helix domain-containing protein [Mesorhizobium onobrychidis]|uniref:Transcriptional regulator n=1 Tax=Mesorhizobium onobrychidis TaxID=2775404 RepID=A0ABY5QSX3_9HYPH|nr:helix-turn-helix domain-containing protein [Mesorhizobium onobrychidis]UVC14029.1 transcriptional regulator [Mesorhizobium onobrychidis]
MEPEPPMNAGAPDPTVNQNSPARASRAGDRVAASLSSARVIPWRAPTSVDVRGIRNKLGMSQKEFAACFGLKLESLRNWEQGTRVPETAARVLFTIIDREPDAVKKALAIG